MYASSISVHDNMTCMTSLLQYDDDLVTTANGAPGPVSGATSASLTWPQLTSSADAEKCGKLRQLVQEVVGTEESAAGVLDDACIHFVQTFAEQQRLSLDVFKGLKLKYGSLSQNNAQKMFAIVKEIVESAPSEVTSKLKNDTLDEDNEDGDYFGKNIPFHVDESDYYSRFDLSYLRPVEEPKFSLNDKLSFNIDHTSTAKEHVSAQVSSTPGVDTQWLENTVRTNYGDELPIGLSVPEFTETLLKLLSSDKSAEALQTELFDLCGFERFDMIGAVLENRAALVRSLTENKASMKAEILSAAASVRAETAGPSRPNYGCQVTVQSEEEKALMKQMRKEEKKINKLLHKAEPDEDEEEFVFDPIDLRTKRQAALANAMNTPLFKERQEVKEFTVAEQFPFVFDSLNKAKLTSGFIQGTKMSLPVGFTRKDDKKWEEVTVPAENKGTGPPDTGKKPVKISSLDDIGQMAFRGIKQLNTIQSTVFETAYGTSENMLVCAPTGAGKTNVAMLCILQCIKQHIEAGIIKRDKFKIVYVAPMKALAAEMTAGFGKRLEPLGITVRELTGDMSLTKTEIANTQVNCHVKYFF